MSPLETFATIVKSLLDEVELRGIFVVQPSTEPRPGIVLDVRQEQFQEDPTTVFVSFRSGHFEWFHRFDGQHVAVIGGAR